MCYLHSINRPRLGSSLYDNIIGVVSVVYLQYMEELLRNNEFLEFFVEGGRTRSGKPVHPKGGLLSVVIDAYANGRFIPVYIQDTSIM